MSRWIAIPTTPSADVITATTNGNMNAQTPVVQTTSAVITCNLSNNIGIIFKGLIDRASGNWITTLTGQLWPSRGSNACNLLAEYLTLTRARGRLKY